MMYYYIKTKWDKVMSIYTKIHHRSEQPGHRTGSGCSLHFDYYL
jgi:hypothetical protein